MAVKTLAQKLVIKAGATIRLINPPDSYADRLGSLPADARIVGDGAEPVDLIQLFVASRTDLEAQLPALRRELKPKGLLWVTYPKGTSKFKGDINRDTIAAYAQTIGFTPVAMIAVDDDWSAIRLKIV